MEMLQFREQFPDFRKIDVIVEAAVALQEGNRSERQCEPKKEASPTMLQEKGERDNINAEMPPVFFDMFELKVDQWTQADGSQNAIRLEERNVDLEKDNAELMKKKDELEKGCRFALAYRSLSMPPSSAHCTLMGGHGRRLMWKLSARLRAPRRRKTRPTVNWWSRPASG